MHCKHFVFFKTAKNLLTKNIDVYMYPTDVGGANHAKKVFSFVHKKMYYLKG